MTLSVFLSAFVLLKTCGQAGSGCAVSGRPSRGLVPSILLFPLGGITLNVVEFGTAFIVTTFVVVVLWL